MSVWTRAPLAFVLPLIAVLIWSVNLVVTRYAVEVSAPMSISFYRWLLAWLLLTPFVLPNVWRQRQILKPYLGQLAILGLFGMVCYQGLAYSAAHYTTATNMGIINAFIPVFSIILSIWLLNIRPSLINLLGTAISIFGLMYLISRGDLSQLIKGGHLFGDSSMILAVALYAFYGVFLQRWRLKLPLTEMLYIQICFAVLFHVPLVVYFGLDALNSHNIAPIVYAGIFPSLIAPFVWMLAVRYLGANRSSIFMNFTPILTAIIAYLFLHDQWTIYHTIGGGLVLIGIILAQKKSAPKLE